MSKLIVHPPSSIDAAVPRERWKFLRTELRWAYCGMTRQQHGHQWFHTPHTSAWLVVQGSANVRTEHGSCGATAGQWLISPPGMRWQQTSLDCKILSVCFIWQWIFGRELLPFSTSINLPGDEAPELKIAGYRLSRKAERLFPKAGSDLPQKSGPVEDHLELQANFDSWLIHYHRAMHSRGIRACLMTLDPRVEDAVQLLERAGGSALRPAELARQLGLSPSQMNRLFLRQLGTTVHGYLERQKLASARMFLGGSQLSVKETAFRLGFLSPQHFSRWFRKRSGVSPTQLRQANAGMI